MPSRHSIASTFFVLFCPAFLLAAEAQRTNPVPIPGSSQHIVYSETIGQNFRIDVAMPRKLPVGDVPDTYPVVYVLDGNALLPMVYSSARTLQGGMEMASAIVVGIGYDTDDSFEILTLRNRDYTPTNDETVDNQLRNPPVEMSMELESGHAKEFIEFIENELKPLINSTYPTDPTKDTLAGYSMGGLFGLYVLFNRADTFDKYIIGSPSVWWDENVIFSFEESFAESHTDLPKTVFISSGSLDSERMTTGALAMYNNLLSRDYNNLDISFVNFEGETHASGTAAALTRGLKTVFAKETEEFVKILMEKLTQGNSPDN